MNQRELTDPDEYGRPCVFSSNVPNSLKAPRMSKIHPPVSGVPYSKQQSALPSLESKVFSMSNIPDVLRLNAGSTKMNEDFPFFSPKQKPNLGSHVSSQLTGVITGRQM